MKANIQLDPQQQAAVEQDSRHIMCIAGPGSGKTRTLTERVRRAVDRGVPPGNIAVVTFTNAGAGEFRRRLDPIRPGFCGTLHSLMLTLLRQHGARYGMHVSGVLDDHLRETAMEEVFNKLKLNPSQRTEAELLCSSSRYSEPTSGPLRLPELAAVAYFRHTTRSGLVDFDMVLHLGRKLLKAIDPVLIPFTHLFCDEVQDSAEVDWDIYHALPCESKFMVGDPDQSIYRFRGAAPNRLTDIPATYETLLLELNYRSVPGICATANRLIAHNTKRVEKLIKAVRSPVPELEPVVFCQKPHAAAEMYYVLQQITASLPTNEDGQVRQTVAVLARTNQIARQFADFIEAAGITVGRQKPPVMPTDWRRTRTILSALAAPDSDEAVLAYVACTQGKEEAAVVQKTAVRAMTSVDDVLKNKFSNPPRGREAWEILSTEFDVSAASCSLVKKLAGGEDLPWAELSARVALTGVPEASPVGQVYVGTIHSAKGREWETVFLVGCEDELMPASEDIEEERRLLFVGVTRAMNQLFVTWSAERNQYRGPNVPPGPPLKQTPSRFLKELNYQP